MEAVSDNALRVLRDEYRKAMNDLSDQITSGRCEDYPSYRYQCGVIHGLALAERALLDLDRRIRDA